MDARLPLKYLSLGCRNIPKKLILYPPSSSGKQPMLPSLQRLRFNGIALPKAGELGIDLANVKRLELAFVRLDFEGDDTDDYIERCLSRMAGLCTQAHHIRELCLVAFEEDQHMFRPREVLFCNLIHLLGPRGLKSLHLDSSSYWVNTGLRPWNFLPRYGDRLHEAISQCTTLTSLSLRRLCFTSELDFLDALDTDGSFLPCLKDIMIVECLIQNHSEGEFNLNMAALRQSTISSDLWWNMCGAPPAPATVRRVRREIYEPMWER